MACLFRTGTLARFRTGTLARFRTILLDEGHVVALADFPQYRGYLAEAANKTKAHYDAPREHPLAEEAMPTVHAQVWLCIQEAPRAEGVSVAALKLQDLADIPIETKSYADYTLEEWTLMIRGLRVTTAWQENTAKLTLESSAAGDLERVLLRGFELLEDYIPGIASRMYWERVLELIVAEAGAQALQEDWRNPPQATPAPGASSAGSVRPPLMTLLKACGSDGS